MNEDVPPTLKYYFVAFIDVLGFSSMVQTDCSGPSDQVAFLPKLLMSHKAAVQNVNQDIKISVTQFSDSIVLAMPYLNNPLRHFAEQVMRFQHALLVKGLLCRGGLSYGKHYEEANFLFSEALIKAYKIESKQANYPRIVIDDDLIDLLRPSNSFPNDLVVYEADGACFLDYFTTKKEEEIFRAVMKITFNWEKEPVQIREKLRWLREYFSFCYPKRLELSVDRFKKL